MIRDNITRLKEDISLICRSLGRNPQEITLVAISKTATPEMIFEALQSGITDIGENRVQDSEKKFVALKRLITDSGQSYPLKYQMVGHLQTNKVKKALQIFDLIQSVDSLRLAEELDKQAQNLQKTVEVLIEVKTSKEASKSGVHPQEVLDLMQKIAQFKSINIKGLMTIAPDTKNEAEIRRSFRQLRQLKEKISGEINLPNAQMQYLSMGMTNDYKIALEEGSNMLRIGRAIFQMNKKIGIIGFGNMGSAIAQRAKTLFDIIVFDKDKAKNTSGLKFAGSVSELMNDSCAVVLAVKPQDIDSVLNEIRTNLKEHLILTIAAGITTKYIEDKLGNARVIRIMPNMPAQIGEGISGLCKGKFSNEGDLNLAWELFRCVGEAVDFDNENMIDALTAVSGSGPAYFCYYKIKSKTDFRKDEFIRELTEAAISVGFDRTLASRLSEKTVEGTISLLMGKNWSCEELIKRVASKGGTTEAALSELDKGSSLKDAVKAALKRAKELSKKG